MGGIGPIQIVFGLLEFFMSTKPGILRASTVGETVDRR